MKQAQIIFNGNIQGVGFRFTTRTFAKECGVTGWVKNLPDGKVEILAEGEENGIHKLCDLLEVQFEGFIRGKQIKFSNASGKFKDFQVAQ